MRMLFDLIIFKLFPILWILKFEKSIVFEIEREGNRERESKRVIRINEIILVRRVTC